MPSPNALRASLPLAPLSFAPLPFALALGALLFGVQGCGKVGRGSARLPPALSSALADGALNAGGEAPLWALQVRPKAVNFSSAQVASITLTDAVQQASPNGAAWVAKAGGRDFRAEITAAACRDGATGLTYPLSARVLALGVTYRGCAARAGQGLGPRS